MTESHVDAYVIAAENNFTGVVDCGFNNDGNASVSYQACENRFMNDFATRAFRRPLTSAELSTIQAVFDDSLTGGDIKAGLELGMIALLTSPQFLYRSEANVAVEDLLAGAPDAYVSDGVDLEGLDSGAYGNWHNPNSFQWVQYDWPQSYSLSSTEIYWFDDDGGVRVPTTAIIEYWDGDSWIDAGEVPLVEDAFNTLALHHIVTHRLRVSMRKTDQSTGILEWRVYGTPTEPSPEPTPEPTPDPAADCDTYSWPPDRLAQQGYYSNVYLFGSGLCTDNASNTERGGWQSSIAGYPMVLLSYYPVITPSERGGITHEAIHTIPCFHTFWPSLFPEAPTPGSGPTATITTYWKPWHPVLAKSRLYT